MFHFENMNIKGRTVIVPYFQPSFSNRRIAEHLRNLVLGHFEKFDISVHSFYFAH